MERVHFLNVKNGDCSWIQHASGRNTVIDICNGNEVVDLTERFNEMLKNDAVLGSLSGNYGYKNHPTNPLTYFSQHKMPKEIFRFILTHPDMDHLDGLNNLITNYEIVNFWDTDNNKQLNRDSFGGQYEYDDWLAYQRLRKKTSDPKTLNLYNGAEGPEYTNDGLEILSPTPELVTYAKEHNDYNTSSYVVLYTTTTGRKVLFCGDSDKKAWESIMDLYSDKVKDIDILIASHHGRKSGGCAEHLDILKPKLTLFGNASSDHLDYSSWNNRGLKHITNNQAGNIVLDFDELSDIYIYVENSTFAEKYSMFTYYNKNIKSYFLCKIMKVSIRIS